MTLESVIQPLASGTSGPATLWVTFLAGILASAVCPCTLPVGLGIASVASASEAGSRRMGLHVASAFFAGIVLSLTVLGAVAGHLGALATEAFGRGWALAMAILSLCAAVTAFCWPRMRLGNLTAWRRPGLFGAFVYGLIFSIGTSVAPLLLLLTVAASDGDPVRGILLALLFGLGRGLPFLAAGMAAGAVTRLARLGLWGRTLQIVSGAALLLVSAYYAQVYADLL
ncbi:thiol:disulfide interchange protein [Streptomyces purpurogeneiscleroticus]|nr:thiol:disulfide interchange protein [Streptomyces purpurogeneiscleroticus]